MVGKGQRCHLATADRNYFRLLKWYLGRNGGTMMPQIIYCMSLVAIWLCSTATVICFLNSGGLGVVLILGAGFASLFSSAALAEEFNEWRHHREASPVKRLLLPPAS